MKTSAARPLRLPALFALGAGFGIAASVLAFRSVSAVPAAPAAAPAATAFVKAAQIIQYGHPERLQLQSQVALVVDDREGVILYAREIDTPRPIASLTKLMTALVILESGVALDTPVVVTADDRDRLKGTRSRLPVGAILTRDDLLRAALVASDNRAAAALARSYPGSTPAFVAAMNAKATALGMTRTRFADASGLDRRNISTARDLAKLAAAARAQSRLQLYSTRSEAWVTDLASGQPIAWSNTNRLVRSENWEIGLSKTGYTADAGNCLVLQVTVGHRPVSVVLLNSWGKLSKFGDARRVRDWLLDAERRVPLTTVHAAI
jgi:D-alanyl-D-alanine endopeptidase (penicillin-binding protein 7)